MSNYQHIIDTFTFIMGTKGVFDLKVDGDLVFSKQSVGRHANDGEVLRLFRDYVGADVPTYP
jgi:selenoprotein W-related protein